MEQPSAHGSTAGRVAARRQDWTRWGRWEIDRKSSDDHPDARGTRKTARRTRRSCPGIRRNRSRRGWFRSRCPQCAPAASKNHAGDRDERQRCHFARLARARLRQQHSERSEGAAAGASRRCRHSSRARRRIGQLPGCFFTYGTGPVGVAVVRRIVSSLLPGPKGAGTGSISGVITGPVLMFSMSSAVPARIGSPAAGGVSVEVPLIWKKAIG